MAFQLPEFGLIALGMMVVILTSGIDLSLTYTSALAGIVIALGLTAGLPILAAILLGLGAAILCGCVNAFFVSNIGVSPILVTIGTMILYEGVSMQITKGGAISGFPEQFYVFGNATIGVIPLPIIIFAIFAIVTYVLLNNTPWGRSVYMIGSNPKATFFSGINTRRVLYYVYLYAALLAAIAGLIMASRYNSAKVDYGSSYLLLSIAAVVLGGTKIQGGYGKVMGTVLGVMIFQILTSALNLYGVSPHIVNIFIGGILIFVLTLNFILNNVGRKNVPKVIKRDTEIEA
nr:ABC transporter permease [Salirhabdus salicampi]